MNEEQKDRFDLESEILGLYHFRSDLDNVADALEKGAHDPNDLIAAIRGIAVSLELYSDKLYATHCEAFNLQTKNNDEEFDEYAKVTYPENYPYNYGIK